MAALLIAFGVTACAPIPELGARPVPRTAASVTSTASLQPAAGIWPDDRWWTRYADPQLTALIGEGLTGSPDAAVAAARFRRAAALARQERGRLRPALDLVGQAGVTKQSYNNGFPREFLPQGWQDTGQVALDLGFDLDLWGRNRARVAAATSDATAAAIDVRQAQLMLTTGIADAYADLARLIVERDLQRRTLELRLASQRLVAEREAAGLETRGNVRQADATLASSRAALAAAEEAILLRRNQLAALVGAGPDRGLAITPPQLTTFAPQPLPSDVTTDLVGRRPDIVAARTRTEAAASRIKVARADFFPAIRLGALVGFQALGIENVAKQGSLYGTVAPAISLPLFRGGALSGAYRGARATFDEAVADYDRTVIAAYQQVADAVASRRFLDERLIQARAAARASEDAYAIARQRYEGGLSPFLDVLVVEDRLVTTRQAVAELEARAVSLDIALVRALGGGFAGTAVISEEPTNG